MVQQLAGTMNDYQWLLVLSTFIGIFFFYFKNLLFLDGTIYTSACDFIQSYSIAGELYYRTVVKFACFSHLSINETSDNVYAVADFVRSDFGRRVFGFSSTGQQMWNFTLASRAIDYYVGDRVALFKYFSNRILF